jgi:hypothetical protein
MKTAERNLRRNPNSGEHKQFHAEAKANLHARLKEFGLGKSNDSHDAQGRFASGANAARHDRLTRMHDETNSKIFSLLQRAGSGTGQRPKNMDNRMRELKAQRNTLREQIHQNKYADSKLGGVHPGLFGNTKKYNANHGEGGRFSQGEGSGNHPQILGLNDRMQANAKAASEMVNHSFHVGAALRSGDRRKADFHRGEIKRLQGEIRDRNNSVRPSHRGSNYTPMGHHIGH